MCHPGGGHPRATVLGVCTPLSWLPGTCLLFHFHFLFRGEGVGHICWFPGLLWLCAQSLLKVHRIGQYLGLGLNWGRPMDSK